MLQFVDDLKANLTIYSQLQDQKKNLESQMDQIKEAIDKWMNLNEVIDYECINTIGELWKLTFQTRKTTKIDKEMLITMLSQDQLNRVMSTHESKFLMCRKMSSSKSTISAPKGV